MHFKFLPVMTLSKTTFTLPPPTRPTRMRQNTVHEIAYISTAHADVCHETYDHQPHLTHKTTQIYVSYMESLYT